MTAKTNTSHDLARDIFRNIVGPPFSRVEGDDPNRIVELAGHQIGDDCFQVGPLDIGLAKREAQPSKIIKDDIEGLTGAVRHYRRGQTPTHTQTPATRTLGKFNHKNGRRSAKKQVPGTAQDLASASLTLSNEGCFRFLTLIQSGDRPAR